MNMDKTKIMSKVHDAAPGNSIVKVVDVYIRLGHKTNEDCRQSPADLQAEMAVGGAQKGSRMETTYRQAQRRTVVCEMDRRVKESRSKPLDASSIEPVALEVDGGVLRSTMDIHND
ncbi:unnamed protein product [Euphydryas editha]|uniref:Uncharacterized protein n=1 Tax=Euphydryas editha TaxID=104508 RepID=A0AAU9UU69_EUPED|nr:unnamed protein product [Euphydryas editha]